ncbi:MAG: pseudouridine synthase [Pseudomonadota bacterium]|uniref:pseudouridine synthase n=1 Tax=Sphingobium sp. TaxID=1912891 RepID=UPI002E217C18
MEPPKKSGPPRRRGAGGPKRPGGPEGAGRNAGETARPARGERRNAASPAKRPDVGGRPPRKPAAPRPANPHPARAASAGDGGGPQRIAKLLARAGVASRREIERMIAEGRISRDGVAIDTPATLLTSLHGVTVDGVAVAAPAPARLFLFHKPTGCLTTERDPAGRPTIYDRLPEGLPRLMPIGRLDMNTEGLLLLTTDGGFKRQMELPATGVPRTYRARAFGDISQQQLEDLFDGLEIDGIRYGRIEANLERRTGRNQWIEMTLTEGKNREVRRVLEHLGLKVSRLIRTAYGPFTLGEMPVGAVDEVRQHDLIQFRSSLKKAPQE